MASSLSKTFRPYAFALTVGAALFACTSEENLGDRSTDPTIQPKGDGGDSSSEPSGSEGDAGTDGDAAPAAPSVQSFSMSGKVWADDDPNTKESFSFALGDPQNSKLSCYRQGKVVSVVGEDADFRVDMKLYLDVDPITPATLTMTTFPNYVVQFDVSTKNGLNFQKEDKSLAVELTGYSPTHMTGTVTGALSGVIVAGSSVTKIYMQEIDAKFDLDIADKPPTP